MLMLAEAFDRVAVFVVPHQTKVEEHKQANRDRRIKRRMHKTADSDSNTEYHYPQPPRIFEKRFISFH